MAQIEKKVFVKGMAILQQRFGKELSEPVAALYYDMLRVEMGTEDFQRACRECFKRDTFFPSPQRLIDLARGGSEEELAEAAWHEVLQVVLFSDKRLDWDGMREPLKAALRAVPARLIIESTGAQQERLKRDFVRAYIMSSRTGETQLVPVIEDGPIAGIVDNLTRQKTSRD